MFLFDMTKIRIILIIDCKAILAGYNEIRNILNQEEKMTKYAEAIYRMIETSDSHLTAEEVHQKLKETYPDVVLATVYNNLNRLYDEGKIHKVTVEGMPDRYDRIVRHDHAVCRYCGSLMDVQFQDLTETLRKQFPDELLAYDLKVFWICPECRRKRAEAQKNREAGLPE